MEPFLPELEASLGIPAELIERAAAARAAAAGTSAESIVRSWAGAGDAPEGAPAAPPATEAVSDEPAAVPVPDAPAAEAPPALAVEVLEGTEPAPSDETEELAEPQEESAGVLAGFPRWLSIALVAVPVLALAYVLIAPNGPSCGTSGQLAIDPETGLAENCDGTNYGEDVISFFSIGEDVYVGAGRCAGCHGEAGDGGTGPAMSGGAVLVTFPADTCSDQIRWVAIGSDNWPDPTYGANGIAVGSSGAAMPGFADSLTPEELAAVVIYERVAFGGQTLADAEADCGVAELELAADG